MPRTSLVAGAVAFLALVSPAGAQGPQSAYHLDLNVREAFQRRTVLDFGLEVYCDSGHGTGLVVAETGTIAGFGRLAPPRGAALAVAPQYRLSLKVRLAGELGFEKVRDVGVAVYRDPNSRHWMYLTDGGAVAVAPTPRRPALAAVQPATWVFGLDLKVRPAGEVSFGKNTKTWGVEVYRDENTACLLYLCESGALAVVPRFADVPVPLDKARAPTWWNGFDLQVRKAGQQRRRVAAFGLEVFRDENYGNLIYITETGSLAVVGGKKDLRPALGQAYTPSLDGRFDLPCRKAGAREFGDLAFGAAAFTDDRAGCLLYLSETGTVTALAR
jgi:hypothetical protein